jgi:putative transposase
MARRKDVFAVGQTYHIFNRSADRIPIFKNKRDCQHSLLAFWFYQRKTPFSFSKFLRLQPENKVATIQYLISSPKLVDILCFSLMPNHYHLLLTQLVENGISKFIGQWQSSFAHYYNIENNRHGFLFESQFKDKLIETDELLIHINRYIHINALTSFIVKDYDEQRTYPWSSLPEYLGINNQNLQISNPEPVLNFFKNIQDYEKFISDQISYQQELHLIKHLTLE